MLEIDGRPRPFDDARPRVTRHGVLRVQPVRCTWADDRSRVFRDAIPRRHDARLLRFFASGSRCHQIELYASRYVEPARVQRTARATTRYLYMRAPPPPRSPPAGRPTGACRVGVKSTVSPPPRSRPRPTVAELSRARHLHSDRRPPLSSSYRRPVVTVVVVVVSHARTAVIRSRRKMLLPTVVFWTRSVRPNCLACFALRRE